MADSESVRIQSLEILVDELIKDAPREDIVKEQMQLIGLEYQTDPLERLNSVLQALHFREPKKMFKE